MNRYISVVAAVIYFEELPVTGEQQAFIASVKKNLLELDNGANISTYRKQ